MKEKQVGFMLRLPVELHQALQQQAQVERRSLNSQIVYLLLRTRKRKRTITQ